jgi:hypothetical protein
LKIGVAHTTNHAGTTSNAIIPFIILMYPGCMQLWGAIKDRIDKGVERTHIHTVAGLHGLTTQDEKVTSKSR